MNTATKLLVALAIAAASLAPASAPAAETGYFIVSDYTTNADVLGGPFSYDGCQFALLKGDFKAPAHCEIKVW